MKLLLPIALALLLVGCADNPGPKPWWLKGEKHYYIP